MVRLCATIFEITEVERDVGIRLNKISGALMPNPKNRNCVMFVRNCVVCNDRLKKIAINPGLQGRTTGPKKNPNKYARR